MDEFLRLFLTGKRAENMEKFRRVAAIFGLIGAILTLVPVFFTIVVENVPLTVVFSVLGVLFGAATAFLKYYEAAYAQILVGLQNEANTYEMRGEERTRNERLYAAWTETLGKRSVFRPLSAALTGFSYLLLAVSAIVCAVYSLPSVVLFVTCLVFGILVGVASGMSAIAEGRARSALYERAEREIGEIKREKFGLSEKKIFAEAENARGFSCLPFSVAMFLKEDVEKEDFCAVSKKSDIAAFAVGLALGVSLLLPVLLAGVWEKLGSTAVWLLAGSVLAVAVGVLFAIVFPLETKKREIYKRNYEKLGEGEADGLRKQLQAAWIRSQKAGNLMFFIALAAPVTLGVILGLIGYFKTAEALLAESIGSCIMAFLVPAAIISIVIWIIMFACYRRKVRPIEAQLKEILYEEGK